MKKLKPENYQYLLRRIDDIKNYVTDKTIKLNERIINEKISIRNERAHLNEMQSLAETLTLLLLSENAEIFQASFITFKKSFSQDTLDYWFQIKADKYLELFELVETDEVNTRTDSKTGEIPTETIPDASNKGC